MLALRSRPAADPELPPEFEPRTVRQHFVVPSVRSGEVARVQGAVVPHRKDTLKAFDLSNSLLGVHSVQISNLDSPRSNAAALARRPAKASMKRTIRHEEITS
jgi:hypothetical protein